jgi:hypothetical protein
MKTNKKSNFLACLKTIFSNIFLNELQFSSFFLSYSDIEALPYCQVRLGQKFGKNQNWSNEFSLADECHRELQSGNSLYYIGISVRNGTADYHDTRIVTFRLTPKKLYIQLYKNM